MRDRDFHVIPVLLPGSERPRRGDVAHLEFLINASWVEFLKTLDDEKEFQRLVWGITGKKPAEAVEPGTRGVCPYRGLEAFGTGRREVLLRPREPDRLAGERPEAGDPRTAGRAAAGGAGAVGQRQVVGRARGSDPPS